MQGREDRLRSLFSDTFDQSQLTAWLTRWREQLTASRGFDAAGVADAMRRVNPWMIARNASVENALTAASSRGDLQPFNRLMQALQNPFEEQDAFADLAAPAPREQAQCYKTFCGT